MEYKVVPFVASIDKKGTSKQVASQLESLIQNHANYGWKYIRLESYKSQSEERKISEVPR